MVKFDPTNELTEEQLEELGNKNFDDFLDFHHLQKSPDITLMTFVCDNPSECGIVSLNSSQKVTSFQEKTLNPRGNLANGAVYLMSQQAIEKISKIPLTKFTNDTNLV